MMLVVSLGKKSSGIYVKKIRMHILILSNKFYYRKKFISNKNYIPHERVAFKINRLSVMKD